MEDIRARAIAARTFTHSIGPCKFKLVTPTRHDLRRIASQHGLSSLEGDAMAMPMLYRYVLESALVGWGGVLNGHAVPGEEQTPLPWSAEAVGVVLDNNPDWEDELGAVVVARANVRGQQLEDAEKN